MLSILMIIIKDIIILIKLLTLITTILQPENISKNQGKGLADETGSTHIKLNLQWVQHVHICHPQQQWVFSVIQAYL